MYCIHWKQNYYGHIIRHSYFEYYHLCMAGIEIKQLPSSLPPFEIKALHYG
jgi:hypothetical protein